MAVSTSEKAANGDGGEKGAQQAAVQGAKPKVGRRQSYLTGRSLSLDHSGIPIIDSFFYQRKTGERTRHPTRN